MELCEILPRYDKVDTDRRLMSKAVEAYKSAGCAKVRGAVCNLQSQLHPSIRQGGVDVAILIPYEHDSISSFIQRVLLVVYAVVYRAPCHGKNTRLNKPPNVVFSIFYCLSLLELANNWDEECCLSRCNKFRSAIGLLTFNAYYA